MIRSLLSHVHSAGRALGVTRMALVWMGLVLVLSPPGGLFGDDPLNALPTQELPVQQRVRQLSEAERHKVALPEDRGRRVLCISTDQPSPAPAGLSAKPLLRVFADGRIEAQIDLNRNPQLCEDQLTEDELTWLLHLAVNQCDLLNRTPDSVETVLAEFEQDSAGVVNDPQVREALSNRYRYEVDLPAGQSNLFIPERALVVRPLRSRLDLAAFASLHSYVKFLAARACLGHESERQAILAQINARLRVEHPGLPDFGIEHLDSAGTLEAGVHTAAFQQEIALGDNRYRRVLGVYIRRGMDAKAEITIVSNEFQKYRPNVGRQPE